LLTPTSAAFKEKERKEIEFKIKRTGKWTSLMKKYITKYTKNANQRRSQYETDHITEAGSTTVGARVLTRNWNNNLVGGS
jgi:hypothetical protein